MADSIQVSDIRLFYDTNQSRSENDKNNKIRENILTFLHNPPAAYLAHDVYGDTWTTLSSMWRSFLGSLCDVKYDDVRVKKMAGRRYNYDHEISFLNEGLVVKIVKTEFKHNSDGIDNLPEYFNAPEKKRFIETCYAEYFYDNYIDRICDLSDTLKKPTKDVYMKCVYSADYSKNKFFEQLKAIEPVIRNEKKFIVQESIKKYLENYGSTINLAKLSEDIVRTQRGKLFILWNLREFKIDSFSEDDFHLTDVVHIKNNNVLVVRSRAGTLHNLLLRWKNHLGILYPAWQISLQR
jgi:arginine repressor